MDTFTIILFGLVILLYLKWILIILVFPFQVLNARALKRWGKAYKAPIIYRMAFYPYTLWEKLFRKGWHRYMLFQISLVPSHHLRRFVYRALGAEVGKNVVFHFKTEIRGIHKLKIGKGTIVGDNALLDARSGLTLGENVNISSNVSLYTYQHDHRDPYFRCTSDNTKPIAISNRAWLGSNVIVLPGVNIGEGAVCCAGCVVTKDVEPYTVVAGIPAKKVNERSRDLQYDFKGKTIRLY